MFFYKMLYIGRFVVLDFKLCKTNNNISKPKNYKDVETKVNFNNILHTLLGILKEKITNDNTHGRLHFVDRS